MHQPSQTYGLRLKPNQDLKSALIQFAQKNQIEAGIVLTAVGSLQQAALRFAGADTTTVLHGPCEVVSLVGTLSVHGIHIHAAIATATGETLGGHVMPGCLVYTTLELAIANLPQYVFKRELDPNTGYRELYIEPSPPNQTS